LSKIQDNIDKLPIIAITDKLIYNDVSNVASSQSAGLEK